MSGKSHGQRSLVGYSPWGHKDSDTSEWLHFLSCSLVSNRLDQWEGLIEQLVRPRYFSPSCFAFWENPGISPSWDPASWSCMAARVYSSPLESWSLGGLSSYLTSLCHFSFTGESIPTSGWWWHLFLLVPLALGEVATSCCWLFLVTPHLSFGFLTLSWSVYLITAIRLLLCEPLELDCTNRVTVGLNPTDKHWSFLSNSYIELCLQHFLKCLR